MGNYNLRTWLPEKGRGDRRGVPLTDDFPPTPMSWGEKRKGITVRKSSKEGCSATRALPGKNSQRHSPSHEGSLLRARGLGVNRSRGGGLILVFLKVALRMLRVVHGDSGA